MTRKFYKTHSNSVNTVYQIQNAPAELHKFVLSWSHYLVLMRVDNPDARSFYEIECAKQNWSVRWLQRQVGSSLYERIALSKDKNEVLRLAKEGQTIEKPSDIIKNPLTLEFLGLKPDVSYSESKLKKEGNELVSATNQLKLVAADGKKYNTDVLDFDGIVALAKVFPNAKANKFLEWFTYSDESLDGKSKIYI